MSAAYPWTAWFFWIGGALLALVGILLLVWALFLDRSRGRRRCPRCWYDMSGTPGNLTCSECGKTVTLEARLFKTRRRWRWAFAALFLCLVGPILILTPRIRIAGWISVAPTSVLLMFAPTSNEYLQYQNASGVMAFVRTGQGGGVTPPTSMAGWRIEVINELERRAYADELTTWQWKWLLRRSWNSSSPPWSVALVARKGWPDESSAFALPIITRNDRTYMALSSRSLRFRLTTSNSKIERMYAITGWDGRLIPATDPWREASLPVSLDGNTSTVDADLVVEIALNDGASSRWQPIWAARQQLPMRVRPNLPRPDSSPELDGELRDAMAIAIDNSSLNVRWSRTSIGAISPLPTLAMKFELLRDHLPVAVANAWWSSERIGGSATDAPTAIPFHYRIDWSASPAIEIFAGSEWALRITSDESLAIRDVASSDYWSGQMTIPLFWNPEDHTLESRNQLRP